MKVGDYVRTKDGLIRKIVEIDKLIYIDKDYISDEPEYHNSLIEEDVIKTSPNIIDLIEVGDYVDGLKVIDIVEHLHGHKDIVMTNGEFQWSTSNDDYNIKSIVTREQFSQMEYKAGE